MKVSPRVDATRHGLASLLPAGVVVSEQRGALAPASLLPSESRQLGPVAPERRVEFAAGRKCARVVLGQLGHPGVPLLAGARREPLWPVGVVGSITHTKGYCAAAAASARALSALGIDAEVNAPLPDGLLSAVCNARERRWLRSARGDGLHWDRVFFSAKESVYKAWYPLTRSWLAFHDVEVRILSDDRFVAELLVGARLAARPVEGFPGRFSVEDGLILTAVWLAQRGAGLRVRYARRLR